MKYAIISDTSVQWFTYIVSIAETGEVLEEYQLEGRIRGEFIDNLVDRECSFRALELRLLTNSETRWYGNWISKKEFERLHKIIQLYPGVIEYNRLLKFG